ncbi:MAG TPA: hypothetical protein VMV43_06955 [Candidatus Nanopelagicaceae bacterium]|nr:hypothetical protein [Candidatus Nanopelagicaceae bacterium]
MYEEILDEMNEKVENYPELKRNYTETPFEKSIDNILDQINSDIVKILRYNRIE